MSDPETLAKAMRLREERYRGLGGASLEWNELAEWQRQLWVDRVKAEGD